MIKIFSVIFLGVVQVKSEQIQCQIVPIKIENGVTGYCCLFLKDKLSEQNRQSVVEEIFKVSHVINGGRGTDIQKPSDTGGSKRNHHNSKDTSTNLNIPITFHDEENHNDTGDMIETRPTSVGMNPVAKPNRQFPSPKPNKEFEETSDKIATMSYESGQDNSSEKYYFSGENSTNVTSLSRQNVTNVNGTKVTVDNRNNIGSPKKCDNGTTKASNGECEAAFG